MLRGEKNIAELIVRVFNHHFNQQLVQLLQTFLVLISFNKLNNNFIIKLCDYKRQYCKNIMPHALIFQRSVLLSGFPFHFHDIKVFYHYAIENFIYLSLIN